MDGVDTMYVESVLQYCESRSISDTHQTPVPHFATTQKTNKQWRPVACFSRRIPTAKPPQHPKTPKERGKEKENKKGAK